MIALPMPPTTSPCANEVKVPKAPAAGPRLLSAPLAPVRLEIWTAVLKPALAAPNTLPSSSESKKRMVPRAAPSPCPQLPSVSDVSVSNSIESNLSKDRVKPILALAMAKASPPCNEA